MLDQNTDRMWYVIGAVIIGAAIILIMNKTFPQLFASVGETFTNKTVEVTKEVEDLTLTDGIGPKKSRNVLNLADVQLKINQDAIKHSGGVTVGYEFFGDPNTAYTISTDIPRRVVPQAYIHEYDVFLSVPEMDSPSSMINGVSSEQSRTVVTDSTGKMTIWFRDVSPVVERITYFRVLDGTYHVQLEKGEVATAYIPY